MAPAHVKTIQCAIWPCGLCRVGRSERDEFKLQFDWELSADVRRLREVKGVETIELWNAAVRCEFRARRRWFTTMRRARRFACIGKPISFGSGSGKKHYTYSYIGVAVSMELEGRMVAIRELYRLWVLGRGPFRAIPLEVLEIIADHLRAFSGVQHHVLEIQRRFTYHNKGTGMIGSI